MKKEITIKFEGSEIIERTASSFGTGCHVIVPKEYKGKTLKIILDASEKFHKGSDKNSEKDSGKDSGNKTNGGGGK